MTAATGTGRVCSRGTLAPASTSRLAPLRRNPGREMVEPEQVLEPLRVLLVALQPVDEGELLVDQRAAAPRQRLEHVGLLQLQPGLLAGQQHGLLVQFVDGVGDLPDLLGGVHR